MKEATKRTLIRKVRFSAVRVQQHVRLSSSLSARVSTDRFKVGFLLRWFKPVFVEGGGGDFQSGDALQLGPFLSHDLVSCLAKCVEFQQMPNFSHQELETSVV